MFASQSTATREIVGTASISSSICLPPNSGISRKNPVTLPPGRATLLTNPLATGSDSKSDADDWNRARRFHRGADRIRVARENDVALERDKLARDFVKLVERRPGKPRFQQHILAVDISSLAQALHESLKVLAADIVDDPDPRKLASRLLRTRRERPRRSAA
jgi:hypothetical protein